jgi:hypothetical protein
VISLAVDGLLYTLASLLSLALSSRHPHILELNTLVLHNFVLSQLEQITDRPITSWKDRSRCRCRLHFCNCPDLCLRMRRSFVERHSRRSRDNHRHCCKCSHTWANFLHLTKINPGYCHLKLYKLRFRVQPARVKWKRGTVENPPRP